MELKTQFKVYVSYCSLFSVSDFRGQMSEVRGQKTGGRGQKTERFDFGFQIAEC